MKELDEIQTLSNGDVTFGLDFEGFGQNKWTMLGSLKWVWLGTGIEAESAYGAQWMELVRRET
jgi:hypothetical protein